MTEVVVVGGGPSGAAVAARLARRGHEVLLLERSPEWRWRACGVFSGPATLHELRRLGLAESLLDKVARPIPRLWVDAEGGASFPLTYGSGRGLRHAAIGFDRSALDPALLEHARNAGADVRTGAAVLGVTAGRSGTRVRVRMADREIVIPCRVVIGADGIRSIVARSVGVSRPALLAPRVGLTYHIPEIEASGGDGHMVVLSGAYCGLAPVRGGRVNVGIVLSSRERRAALQRDGARVTADSVVAEATRRAFGQALTAEPMDPIAGAAPIAHRVANLAGDGWLLAGDAAGFLDPFTGEGLNRALVSARLADAAVAAWLGGRRSALAAYDATMRRRFLGKDVVSWIAQAFLGRPALFAYAARRLASRPALAERMGLIMGDMVPASSGLDPRYLIALLRP